MEKVNEMSCAEIVEILSDYFEGALSADFTKLCTGHLADCEACKDYYRGLVFAIGVTGEMRSAQVVQPPPDHLARLFRHRKSH